MDIRAAEISRVIKDEIKNFDAEAKALPMMMRFVAEASPAEILKMLAKLDVVRDDKTDYGGNQVVIVLGTQEQPLEPPVIVNSGHLTR